MLNWYDNNTSCLMRNTLPRENIKCSWRMDSTSNSLTATASDETTMYEGISALRSTADERKKQAENFVNVLRIFRENIRHQNHRSFYNWNLFLAFFIHSSNWTKWLALLMLIRISSFESFGRRKFYSALAQCGWSEGVGNLAEATGWSSESWVLPLAPLPFSFHCENRFSPESASFIYWLRSAKLPIEKRLVMQ